MPTGPRKGNGFVSWNNKSHSRPSLAHFLRGMA